MGNNNHPIRRAYGWLITGAGYLQSLVLLGLRLYWGWHFFITGEGKLTHLAKVTDYFRSLHIPMPAFNATLAGSTECVGGLLLLIGLGTRLVCLPLIFVLGIAYVTAESDALRQIFSDPDKFVTATPFLFLEACVIVFVFGPGRFSVDYLLEKTVFRRSASPSAPVP